MFVTPNSSIEAMSCVLLQEPNDCAADAYTTAAHSCSSVVAPGRAILRRLCLDLAGLAFQGAFSASRRIH